MSRGLHKRSRCVSCGLVTQQQPTFAYLLVQLNRHAYLEPGRAQLCAACREAWWEPFQLPLWPDDELELQELPSEAPEWSEQPKSTASWPPSSFQAWRDRRLSRLVGTPA